MAAEPKTCFCAARLAIPASGQVRVWQALPVEGVEFYTAGLIFNDREELLDDGTCVLHGVLKGPIVKPCRAA